MRTISQRIFSPGDPDKEPELDWHQKWGHLGEIDKEGRRCYLANLLALDDGVNCILNALEESGQRENTMVVFVSDNGGTINMYANNGELRGMKYMFGEGGIRIPMLVSMPGKLPQGKVNSDAIVSAMDIFPTALELAGGAVPDKLDGKSLLPVLKGKKKTEHDFLAWAQNRNVWVVRKGKWKLTNNVGYTHRNIKILENDIGETTNLAEQYPEVVRELLQSYNAWNEQLPDPYKRK